MKHGKPIIAALSAALALAYAAPAIAQSPAPTPAQQQELDAARVQLDQAAARFGELARKYGIAQGRSAHDRIRVEQRLLRKPVIGVLLAPDAQAGVRVAGVTPDGAAAIAGLRSGDRLLTIDGRTIVGTDADARLKGAREMIGAHDDKSQVRVGYARDGHEATVVVTPKAGDRLLFIGGDDGDDGTVAMDLAEIEKMTPGIGARFAAIAPDIRREIIRIGPDGNCEGEHCKVPVLAEALRWNGFNLASVDPQLGRYFGADHGVLVLSTGPELAGLQAGDVIRSIDGKPVDSPRAAMDALRGRAAGSRVAIDYLRDRKPATAQIAVPEPMRLRMPMPMSSPRAKGAAAPRVMEKRKVVIVDDDGTTRSWVDDDATPPPPLPPAD